MISVLAPLTDDERKEYWAALALRHSSGIGVRTVSCLLANYGSAYEALQRIINGNVCGCRLARDSVAYVRGGRWRESALGEYNAASICEGRLILWTSPDYPVLLREIPDPPSFLYARGDVSLLKNPSVAVVGTRHASADGCRATAALAGGLADAGVTVVSGLARGIDAEAHRVSVGRLGKSIAVLGTGIDVVYPWENHKLYDILCADGLILSEFAPQTKPEAKNFPIRNRIISGLSFGTLVVEAAVESGSLITARCALDQNRSVYAVGGGVGEKHFLGCQELIKQGAQPVFSYKDILDDLMPLLIPYCQEGMKSPISADMVPIPVKPAVHRQTVRANAKILEKTNDKVHAPKRGKSNFDVGQDIRQSSFSLILPSDSVGRVEIKSECQNGESDFSESSVSERILHILTDHTSASVDTLSELLDISAGDVSAALVMLEVEGRVIAASGGMYRAVGSGERW